MVITGYIVMLLSGPGIAPTVDNEQVFPTLKECVTASMWPTDNQAAKRQCFKLEAKAVNYDVVEKK